MPGHVFISFGHADRTYVSRLAEHLTSHGIPVWYDHTMGAGDDLRADCREAVDACGACVAVLTAAAVASERVRSEIGYAVERGKPVLPLLLGLCQFPVALAGTHYEDVRGGRLPDLHFTWRLLALTAAPRPTAALARRSAPVPTPLSASGPLRVNPGPTLRGHADAVSGVAIAPDGGWLASSSFDGSVRLWRVDGSPLRMLPRQPAGATGVAIAPDGTWLATGGDRTVGVWDVNGRVRAKLVGHTKAVWALAISPDARYIASAGIDRSARVWPSSGAAPVVLSGHTDAVMAVAVGPGGEWLATGGTDHTVRLWRPGGDTVAVLSQPDAVSALAIAPDGRWLVVAAGGAAWVWNADGSAYRTFDETTGVRSLAIAATGAWFAAGCDDGSVALWHMGQGSAGTLLGHADAVGAVAIAASGSWLASGSRDRTVRLWQRASPAHLLPGGPP